MTPKNKKFKKLIEAHELCSPTSEPTCFKSVSPTCIENFLTNKKTCFMKTLIFETAFSQHHKFIGTMLGKPNIILFPCYKNYDNGKFEEELKKTLLPASDFESFHFAF